MLTHNGSNDKMKKDVWRLFLNPKGISKQDGYVAQNRNLDQSTQITEKAEVKFCL